MNEKLFDNTIEGLLKAGSIHPVMVGFDGFVDSIIHVVSQRYNADSYSRVETIMEFSEKIKGFAGLSGNMELVTLQKKLGGNGPIMANAMIQQGHPMTYIGAIGNGRIHPLFAEFAHSCEKVITITDPAHTDALEFKDGKIMFGHTSQMFGINWDLILQHVKKADIERIVADSKLMAFTNWTMIPSMNEIITQLSAIIAEAGHNPWIFFDLADPSKRTDEDIRSLFDVMKQLSKHSRIILGLNLNESRIIASLLGIDTNDLKEKAFRIRKALGIYMAVIHPVEGASAANSNGAWWIDGPYTDSPNLTTGAGDNFNAGFCHGCLAGLSPQESLLVGVATSGFYVRECRSPSEKEIIHFLRNWPG